MTPALCMGSMFCGRVASSATVWTKVTLSFWYFSNTWSTARVDAIAHVRSVPSLTLERRGLRTRGAARGVEWAQGGGRDAKTSKPARRVSRDGHRTSLTAV